MDTIRGHFRVSRCWHVVSRAASCLRIATVDSAMCVTAQAQGALKRIDIPSSIPGLTTRRLLVMSFIDGLQVGSATGAACDAPPLTTLHLPFVNKGMASCAVHRSPSSATAWVSTQPGSSRWASSASCRECPRRMAA